MQFEVNQLFFCTGLALLIYGLSYILYNYPIFRLVLDYYFEFKANQFKKRAEGSKNINDRLIWERLYELTPKRACLICIGFWIGAVLTAASSLITLLDFAISWPIFILLSKLGEYYDVHSGS